MADFARIPETDELGVAIVKKYFDRQVKRLQPALQSTYDEFVKVSAFSSDSGGLDANPNLREAMSALIQLDDAFCLNSDDDNGSDEPSTFTLEMDEIVAWRDRLVQGAQMVAVARLFWLAHVYKCPELSQ